MNPFTIDIHFPEDTQLTLDQVQHKCDPKVGTEKTFMFVEYLCKVDGCMFTFEARVDGEEIPVLKKYMKLSEFTSVYSLIKIYPRGGFKTSYEEKGLTEEKESDNVTSE